MPAISVIMPVFNGEKHISECLDSLINQSFKDYELIIINDGSTDNTKAICESYSACFKSFSLLDEPNCGVSVSRNKGLDRANGDYVFFMDADDLLSNDCLAFLYEKACATGADLVSAGYQEFDSKTGNSIVVKSPSDALLDSSKALDTYGEPGSPCEYISPKLFNSDKIKKANFRFDASAYYGEDTLFSMSFIKNSSYVCLCNKVLYYYRKYPESSSAKAEYSLKGLENLLYVYNSIVSLSAEGRDARFVRTAQSRIVNTYIICFVLVYVFHFGDMAMAEKYKFQMNHAFELCDRNMISMRTSLKVKMINYFPSLLKLYYRKKNSKLVGGF